MSYLSSCHLFGKDIRIGSQGIIGPVMIFADIFLVGIIDPCNHGDFFSCIDIVDAVVSLMGLAAGVHIIYPTDAPVCSAFFAAIISINIVITVQTAQRSHDTPSTYAGACPDCAGKKVGLKISDAILPGLEGCLKAFDSPGDIGSFYGTGTKAIANTDQRGVGGCIDSPACAAVPSADYAPGIHARCNNLTGKYTVLQRGFAHGIALTAHDAAHIGCSVDRGPAPAAGDGPVEITAKGSDLLPVFSAADDHAVLYGAGTDLYRIIGRAVSADKAETLYGRSGTDGNIFNEGGPRGLASCSAMVGIIIADQTISINVFAGYVQIADGGRSNVGK